MDHLFGPVLSRRLGLSMGVDLLSSKTCNLDCVYCELGKTHCLTTARRRFVPPDRVLRNIKSRADEAFDHLTFAGSGEPTLCSDLGEIIRASRKLVDAPIAVITNSTLLASPEVRREVCAADVVLPSLDAASQRTFQAVNQPAPGIRIEEIIEGLRSFRRDFSGEIWLEVMLVKGLNEHEADLIARAAESISPDRIQLNTVVRPPAEPVDPLSEDEMERMLSVFEGAEIIPDWDWRVPPKMRDRLLDLLKERSYTLEEICELLELESSDAIKYCKILERDCMIQRRMHGGRLCFHAPGQEN